MRTPVAGCPRRTSRSSPWRRWGTRSGSGLPLPPTDRTCSGHCSGLRCEGCSGLSEPLPRLSAVLQPVEDPFKLVAPRARDLDDARCPPVAHDCWGAERLAEGLLDLLQPGSLLLRLGCLVTLVACGLRNAGLAHG